MDITESVKALFSKGQEEDFSKLEDKELDDKINHLIHEVDTGWMSTSERDSVKDQIDALRKIQHERASGKTKKKSEGEIDPKISDESKKEAGVPKSAKERFKAIKAKKGQPDKELNESLKPTISEEEDESVVPPTNITGGY